MGVIEHVGSGRRVTLGRRCLVGRAERCDLQLDEPLISSEHAVLHWSEERWTVRDLGSRNGTTLDGQVLEPGRRSALKASAELVFGGAGARWRLIDDAAPLARARARDGDAVCEEDSGLLALPDPDAPQACLFQDDEGIWWVEHDGPARPGRDQEELELAGSVWRLELPQATAASALPTTRQLSDQPTVLEEATLSFAVSRDEEHIELSVIDGARTFELGARAHHYLLLLLARARQQDAEAQQDEAERGWLYADELARDMGLDLTQLNLHVFRARKQLAKAGILNAGKIVERRAGSRQLRLGPALLQIS